MPLRDLQSPSYFFVSFPMLVSLFLALLSCLSVLVSVLSSSVVVIWFVWSEVAVWCPAQGQSCAAPSVEESEQHDDGLAVELLEAVGTKGQCLLNSNFLPADGTKGGIVCAWDSAQTEARQWTLAGVKHLRTLVALLASE